MFRARPLQAAGLLALVLVGAAGGGWFWYHANTPLATLGGVSVLVGCVWWAYWKVSSLGTALIITNKRTIHRQGLLSRQTREVVHDRVQDIQITQSFTQRLYNVGTLGLSSAGESGVEIVVEDLPDPKRLREIIDAYRNL